MIYHKVSKLQIYFRKLLIWRATHIKGKQFIYILSILVGFLSGVASVILKNAVSLVEELLTHGVSHVDDALFFIYPLAGIVVTVLVVRFILGSVEHGIPNALYAISKGNGNIDKKSIYSSILTSALTVGFGGSAGLEGPAVSTSSAIGSTIGQRLKLNYKTKVLLIACAASGSLAAIFKAPVAAIVFAVEVIMIDLTAASLIPLLMASLSAALVSRFFLGDDILFHFDLSDPFLLEDLPFYSLLGLLCGAVSVYFNKIYFAISKVLEGIQSVWWRMILGGVTVGAMIFLFPGLYGEGYPVINALVEGDEKKALEDFWLFDANANFFLVGASVLFLALLKPIATTLTVKSGGVGGVFAPTLFIGSSVGYFFSKMFNDLKLAELSKSNFTLVAMGGLMAGVLQAPLTGIFLIAEITGGYELFIPLMITASIAYLTVKYATPHSIYTRQLAKRGELITHHKDQAVLTLMNLEKEIETNFLTVRPYQSLGDLVKVVSNSSRNIFPVTDEENVFLGVVMLNDIRGIMFDKEQYDKVHVHEIMVAAPEFIFVSDTMESVMKKFDASGAWNLPVVSQGRKYIGFVSKSKLFSAYRGLLKDFYDEED